MVVKKTVAALLPDGQAKPLFLGQAGHHLGVCDRQGHGRFGENVQTGLHGRHCRRRVQVRRQGDNHGLQAVGLGGGQQFFVGPDYMDLLLNVLGGFRAFSFDGRRSRSIACCWLEGRRSAIALSVMKAGLSAPPEAASLSARAEDAHGQRLVQRLAVVEVVAAQAAHVA